MADSRGIKTEVKQDPDLDSVRLPFGHDDMYEDAGDMEFNDDPSMQHLYLARLPRQLWERWAKVNDDAEIHLGTIRQSTVMENGRQKVCLAWIGKRDADTLDRSSFKCF
jgi:transcription initiation factor TFIIF subunit beta